MARRIYYKRKTNILGLESIAFSIIITAFLFTYLQIHWSIAVIFLFGFPFLFLFAFFEFRLFRYMMSVLFSMAWGLVFFAIGNKMDPKESTAAIVFASVAYLVSLYLHKDQFDFINKATFIEYDRY